MVKSDMVKWQLTHEVYCSKLDRVLPLNRDVIGSNGVVWEVEARKDYDPGGWEGKRIKIYCSCFTTTYLVQKLDHDGALTWSVSLG